MRARTAFLLSMVVLASAALSGCRHTQGRTPSTVALEPAGVRGERVLVVPADGGSAALAAGVARHLSTLPIRVCRPEDYGGESSAGGGWRAWAWERRIPYVFVTGGSAADGDDVQAELLPSSPGEAVRQWAVPRGDAVPVELRARLRDDLRVPPERADGHPTTWMVCPQAELQRLRTALLVQPDEATLEDLRRVRASYPLDPALTAIEGVLLMALGDEEEGRRLLLRAQVANPEGAAELAVLARMAGRAGLEELGLALWQLACELWPGRLDYALALAELLEERQRVEEAGNVLLLASATVEVGEDLEGVADRPDRAAVLASAALLGDLRYLLGWMLHRQGTLDTAVASYSTARELYEAVDEPENVAACRNNIGVALVESNRAVAAIPHLRAALAGRGDGEPSEEEANTLYNLGAALQAVGRLDEADRTWRTAAAQYRSVGAVQDQFETLLDVVINRGEMGSSDDVEVALEIALRAIEGHEAHDEFRAMALDAVGVARARVDRIEEALAALEEALEIWVSLGDRLHEGQTRYNMAIPHLAAGDVDAALECLEGARAIALEQGDTESVVAIDQQKSQIERMR